MAITFIPAVISGILQGARKALSIAITKTLAEAGVPITKTLLNLSNTEALLLTRIKKHPNAQLRRTLANTLGMTDKQLQESLKKYHPTIKASELAKGYNFTKALNNQISKDLNSSMKEQSRKLLENIGYFDNNKVTIKTIKNKLKNDKLKNEKPALFEILIKDKNVKQMLSNIENALIERVYGLYGNATNKTQLKHVKKIDIIGLYEPNIEYTDNTLNMLQVIYDKIIGMPFDLGSDSNDVWVIEEDAGDYGVYSASFIKNFIEEIIADVSQSLLASTDKRFKGIKI